MYTIAQTRRKEAWLLATGQTTSYGSGAGVDDGALQKGIVKSYTVLTTGQYSGVTDVTLNGKTDAHSNNCVYDNSTKLTWLRYVSASVGPASDGLLPWTTNANGEGIFPYCAAANAAGLGGYSDWRIPNIFSLYSLTEIVPPSGVPNSVAFPSFPGTNVWSSTVRPNSTSSGLVIALTAAVVGILTKTTTASCVLVRG